MTSTQSQSRLSLQAVTYSSAVSARDVLNETASTTATRMELRRDPRARAAAARLLRAEAPDAQADVVLETELAYDPADPAASLRISLTAASLPLGCEAAVVCPEQPKAGIPRTPVEQGRFISVERAPSLFGKPVSLHLQLWLNEQPLLTGGSLALEVSRMTTEAEAGLGGVMRDPQTGLPVAQAPGGRGREVAVRLGQVIWALHQG